MATTTLPIQPPAPPSAIDEPELEIASKDASAEPTRLEATDADAAVPGPAAGRTPAGDVVDVKLGTDPMPKKKKKRKGKKSGNDGASSEPPKPTTGKAKSRPSGFEEFVADGPITKAEVEIEEQLYAPDKPFVQRMETCIQRYKARRKFDVLRMKVFTAYLRLGGVETGQKQYLGGVDEKKLGDLDAEQIGLMAATEFITFNDNGGEDAQEYEVDFAFVVRGFLSYKLPYGLGITKAVDLAIACQVVRNFLSYVVYHNVCPEYSDNVKEALKLCDLAEKELVLCAYVSNLLPGAWNTACSTLYGGVYAGMCDPEATWDDDARNRIAAGLDPDIAKKIVVVGLSRLGTPEQISRGLDRKVTSFKHFLSLEVLEVVMPDPSPVLPEDADMSLPENKYFRNVQALGYITTTAWTPHEPFEDDPPEIEDHLRGLEINIWLEKVCLQYCFPGMHIEAKVHRFDDGVIFIDSVTAVMCSFYMRLDYPKEDKDKDGYDSDD